MSGFETLLLQDIKERDVLNLRIELLDQRIAKASVWFYLATGDDSYL